MANEIHNLTEEELFCLEEAKDLKEWEALCDEIKRVRHGQYPPDFGEKVRFSGVMTSKPFLR